MILLLKGIIIGIGKIIPGVSGSLLAIRLNVYERLIYSVNNLFKDFKNNSIFLIKLGIGIIISIIFGSKIIIHLLDNYYWFTKIIFIILIITGIPVVIKEVNNYYISILSFTIYILLLYIPNIDLLSSFFFIGFLEAFTTIIPGISGTAIFMSFGLYDELLNMFANIHLLPLKQLLPFSIGLIIGGIIIIRFIDYCFKYKREKTYSVILGLLLGSLLMMIIKR